MNVMKLVSLLQQPSSALNLSLSLHLSSTWEGDNQKLVVPSTTSVNIFILKATKISFLMEVHIQPYFIFFFTILDL